MQNGVAAEERIRIALDFTLEAYDGLAKLKTLCNQPSNAEIIRHSLRLLAWVTEERAKGKKILVDDHGTIKLVVIASLFDGMQNNEVEGEKKRVVLDFTNEAYDFLFLLRTECRQPNNSATIRQALRLLKWVMEQETHGNKLLIETGGEMKEVVIQSLFANLVG
jgi:Arc/MetJ-type ribon-helix-helix transcriptional regulator